MTSGLDGLGTASLPNLTTLPSVANAPALGQAAAARTGGTGAGGFDRLMNLQSRGRALEAKLAKQAAAAGSADPASTARGQQASTNAKQLGELRALVGPNPKGNARRALAAIIARLEGGGEVKGTDRLRIRLAIAADERRVTLPDALRIRDLIMSIDTNTDAIAKQADDPTLVQDPARVAIFKQQMGYQHDGVTALDDALGASKVTAAVAQRALDAAIMPKR